MSARSRRELRFWRWFRTLPILVLVVLALGCVGASAMPGQAQRSLLYPVHHAEQITQSAARHGVDPHLVCAVIKRESNWDEGANSKVGAQGLMQLMPATAQEMAQLGLVDASVYDPANLCEPATNIEYGCAYLAWLQRRTTSLDQVIAAYNAGPGSVSTWQAAGDGTEDFADLVRYPETRVYLQRVRDTYARYQELYPSGITDA